MRATYYVVVFTVLLCARIGVARENQQPPSETQAVVAKSNDTNAGGDASASAKTSSTEADLQAQIDLLKQEMAAIKSDFESAQEEQAMSALEESALADEVLNQDTNISGFFDVTFAKNFPEKDSLWDGDGGIQQESVFFIQNFNVYLSKQLTESISLLGEVRFAFRPPLTSEAEEDTMVAVNPNEHPYTKATFNWGGVGNPLSWTMPSPFPMDAVLTTR